MERFSFFSHLYNATHLRRSIHYGSCRACCYHFLALDGHCILGTGWLFCRDGLTFFAGTGWLFCTGRVGLGTRCPTPCFNDQLLQMKIVQQNMTYNSYSYPRSYRTTKVDYIRVNNFVLYNKYFFYYIRSYTTKIIWY